MKSKAFIVSLAVFVVIPLIACPITLVRVGYINLDNIIQTYTEKYLDTEISIREQYVQLLQSDYNMNYFTMTDTQREQLQEKISNQRTVLNMLRFNMAVWKNTDELREDLIYRIVQRDIMEAIKKTSELEGFNLILDNTGNFVYGSDDINLTDKVFFRLDEKLLDLQNKEPVAPLDLELEGQQEGAEYLND